MIRFPVSRAVLSSEELVAAMMFFIWEKSRMLSRICLSRTRRSVTTITESKRGLSLPGTWSSMSW